VFDAKVMNCTFSLMFYALCAWDGARLAAPNELLFAWQAGEGRKFPWGSAPNDATLSPWSYAHDYPPGYPGHWPDVPEPGRYPAGNGKFGHSDLAGAFLHITNQVSGSKVTRMDSGSWQEHPITTNMTQQTVTRSYWATSARCTRPAAN
jgi:hypothetical protein